MRNLIDILDLSCEELDELMQTALDIAEHPDKYAEVCKGKKLATLFFEPSTRTRLSFEAAMLELGGSVIGFSDAGSSSAAKGESVADTAKVLSCYSDIIAIRHPREGAARVAAENSDVPVINAGDGGHCHPTQTLADLLTIYREKGSLGGLKVGLCGDLRYGRTVHSLVNALSRYEGNSFVFISPEELRMPEYVIEGAFKGKDIKYEETTDLDGVLPDLDVLYMTRIQKERFSDPEAYERLKGSYILTEDKMKIASDEMIVMHPLPRVNEISVRVDSDPRAAYFRQVMNGKLMRMSIIVKFLSEKSDIINVYTHDEKTSAGTHCTNPKCIMQTEQELEQKTYVSADGKTRCVYCDREI